MCQASHTFRSSLCFIATVLALALGAGPVRAGAGEPGQAPPAQGMVFRVTLPPTAQGPVSGRLLVYLIKAGSTVAKYSAPIDGPFYFAPQPLYGVDVKDLKPGQTVTVGDQAVGFPCKAGELGVGIYKVQAALDRFRQCGSWRRESGNPYSLAKQVSLSADRPGAVLDLVLDQVMEAPKPPPINGVEIEYVEVRSALLSEFYGREFFLQAAVLPPISFDPSRKYPAVYEVPGFGGNHFTVTRDASVRSSNDLTPDQVDLQTNSFLIGLSPDSPNGHTLFANSANNGPWGDALTKELIPELERRFPLVASPGARAIRGHSSGGWSAVWLALQYPGVFGGAWAGSPDPLDFRAFQRTDIYKDASFYTTAAGQETPSTMKNNEVRGTVRQENLYEEALGPDNTSGEQWDSWQAVFGPKGPRGNPAALFDPGTGAIDRAVAESYRKYDVADLIRSDPKRYGPLFQQRIRILVGDQDDWNLNAGCALVADELTKAGYALDGKAGPGSITIVRMMDHGTILQTPQARHRDREIADFFRAADPVKVPAGR